MKIDLYNEKRFTAGVVRENEILCLPAAGGGIFVNEIRTAPQRYLNLTLTVLEEHSLAFELRVWAAGEDKQRVTVRFGLMPNYRANICIDLNWLDGHILFPGHVPGELKVVCHGSRIDRAEIVRAEIISVEAYHDVRVQLEDVELSDTPRPAAPVPETKLIDEFGQYLSKNWQGKVRSREELNTYLRAQAALPGDYPFANWTQWGGFADRKLAEPTGFFSKIKKDGRWYLTDPSGCAFYSMGPDCVRLSCDGRIDGLESLLEWLPDDPELVENSRRQFGEIERGPGKAVSFARANMKHAFGEKWEETWRAMVVKQLKAMGMNTLGNWSDPSLFGRMPYVTSLERFPQTSHFIFRDFPDVLSPEYAADAEECAKTLAQRKGDPWMIGYFLRNEPSWAFVDDLIIADEVLRDAQPTACKAALIAQLKQKYASIEALNAAWNAGFASFEVLETPIAKASALSAQAEADLRAFSAQLIRAYTEIPANACRKVDPNHMILGMRWAWISDPALVSGWECFDVFSINCYAVDPTYAIARVEELKVDLPVMIGEFHFGALDSGLTATGLEAVATQKDRGMAYRYYCEHAAAHPQSVGCHYFQCYDQFALGRFDGENYNIGLFDVCMQPYGDMAAAIRACSENIAAVHSGETEPTQDAPVSLPMIAY